MALEDPEQLRALFATEMPDLLIHCGGVCGVRKCEQNPEWAWRMNVDSMAAVVGTVPEQVRIVYASSDHVFGHREGACDEETPVSPISQYGRTRVAAEELLRADRPDALIIRVPLTIGPSLDGRTGHWDWLRYRCQGGLPITVIRDEVRTVVSGKDVGEAILTWGRSTAAGVRHLAGPTLDRVTLARRLCEEQNLDVDLKIESRHQQAYPHLGTVRLTSLYAG